MATNKSRGKKPKTSKFILNCVPSLNVDRDWTMEAAAAAGVIDMAKPIPPEVDLRAGWWTIRNQADTGACVGFATADGLLRYHLVKSGKITSKEFPSPRFIWMANKETDEITEYPTTFLEPEGTQTKLALRIARKYGCVMEKDLPMSGKLSPLSMEAFYTKAAKLRITSFHNLVGSSNKLERWKRWLALQGPILTRLGVDATWDNAENSGGHLKKYRPETNRGGHAVCLVGYTGKYFVVRNSWGTGWGDKGFAYAWNDYAEEAFTEAYGLVI
jgi:hypothetical protein